MQNQVNRLYKPLFRYIKKRISSPEDAQDLTQEVFYKLAKSDGQHITSVKNWVYTIAKNTITDYYRKRKLITEVIEENNLGGDEAEEEQVASQLSTCIAPFVEQLPNDYREIMKLSELEDVSQKEIAERLGLNYTTVRSKVQRGRKKLKAIVTDCCEVVQGGMGSIMNFERKKPCTSNCE